MAQLILSVPTPSSLPPPPQGGGAFVNSSLKDMPILIAIDISITNIFNTCALKGYVWFSLHHHPSEKLLPAILFSSHIEEKQELFKECK